MLVQDLHVVRVVVSRSGTLGLLPGVDWVQVLQDAAESVILFQLTCGIVRGMGCVLGQANGKEVLHLFVLLPHRCSLGRGLDVLGEEAHHVRHGLLAL